MHAWMQTHSGKLIDLLEPDPGLIDIHDIAAHLAHICRFAGACHGHYSVAEHSVRVARLCAADPLAGLLHDAHEAYLGDITRPARTALLLACGGAVGSWRDAERRLDVAIAVAFGFDAGRLAAPEVKAADNTLLATELRDLMAGGNHRGTGDDELPPPLAGTIRPWDRETAYHSFLGTFEQLVG